MSVLRFGGICSISCCRISTVNGDGTHRTFKYICNNIYGLQNSKDAFYVVEKKLKRR